MMNRIKRDNPLRGRVKGFNKNGEPRKTRVEKGPRKPKEKKDRKPRTLKTPTERMMEREVLKGLSR